MEISSTSGLPTSQPNEDRARANLNYDAFLKLLIAQLKNQDPTQPQDPSQTLSQIASFSNVEQAIKINAKLDELIGQSAVSQAANLLGRSLASADGIILGEIKSIALGDDGSSAVLDDGTRVKITTGMEIR